MEIDDWIHKNREKIADIVAAEKIVQNGRIELFYQDRRYLGLDVQNRLRLRPLPKNKMQD